MQVSLNIKLPTRHPDLLDGGKPLSGGVNSALITPRLHFLPVKPIRNPWEINTVGSLDNAVVVKARKKRILRRGLGKSIALLVEYLLDVRVRENEVFFAMENKQRTTEFMGTIAMVLLLPLVHLGSRREIGFVEVHISQGHIPEKRDGDVKTSVCREFGNINELLGGIFGEVEGWKQTGNRSEHIRDKDLLKGSAFSLFNNPRD